VSLPQISAIGISPALSINVPEVVPRPEIKTRENRNSAFAATKQFKQSWGDRTGNETARGCTGTATASTAR
jgi:hypothetical protein